MASLSKRAAQFLAAFPTVGADLRKLERALDSFDRRRSSFQSALTSLAGALLFDPPVDQLAAQFAQDTLVNALRHEGLHRADAEAQATLILAGVFSAGECPLFGLRVSVGAPRRGVEVTALSEQDEVIEAVHDLLRDALALPAGPQEHGDGVCGPDSVPSEQWSGHVTAHCVPAHDHDVLLTLPGRSIGVGESLAIAADLLIPSFVAMLPGDRPAEEQASEAAATKLSCRLQDESTVRQIILVSGSPEAAAQQILEELAAAAGEIRRKQRARILKILDLHRYRAYLETRQDVAANCAPNSARQVADPFEFASLTDLQLDELAREVGALTRAEHTQYELMGPTARAGLTEFLSRPEQSAASAGELLRAGVREMAFFADEPLKAARRFTWDAEGWQRLWEKLGRP